MLKILSQDNPASLRNHSKNTKKGYKTMVFVALLTRNKLQKPDQVLATISNCPSSNNFFLAKSPGLRPM